MEVYLLEAKDADTRTITVQDIKYGIALEMDLWLDLTSIQIGTPEIWEHCREIPGGEIIDLTEFTGRVEYKRRPLTITASRTEDYKDWINHLNKIMLKLHGKKFHILLGDDETHFYTGRCKVSSTKDNPVISDYVLEFTCNPTRHILPPVDVMFKDIQTGLTNPTLIYQIETYIGRYASGLTVEYTKIDSTKPSQLTILVVGVPMVTIDLANQPIILPYAGEYTMRFQNVQTFSLSIENKEL